MTATPRQRMKHPFIEEERSAMLKLSVIVWIVLGTTLAGLGLLAVLMVPSLADQAMKSIPYAVVAGFVVAMPLSHFVARQISAMR